MAALLGLVAYIMIMRCTACNAAGAVTDWSAVDGQIAENDIAL